MAFYARAGDVATTEVILSRFVTGAGELHLVFRHNLTELTQALPIPYNGTNT